MDSVVIRGLEVDVRIGVTEDERSDPQSVLIDLTVDGDLTTAATSDDLADTLDYDALVEEVATIAEGRAFNLIERLAGEIADRISSNEAVERVTVEIAKKEPPVRRRVGKIAVRIERTR